jgi:hypothetical protein
MESRYGRLFRGVWVIALATLLYEIALIRVLSFTIWYHFAYVVISTALLGYGASGAVLAMRPSIGARDLERTLSNTSLIAALTATAFFALVAVLPFDPLNILQSPRDLLLMIVYEVGATIPFFFSGLTVSLALRAGAARVDRLYFWDLVGAGMGCALAIPLMNWLSPPGAMLGACGVFGLSAIAFGGWQKARLAGAVSAVLLVAGLFGSKLPISAAPSKSLSIHIDGQKMKPVFSHWTALFRTDVVKRQPHSPLTNADEWGLSSTVKYAAQPIEAFVTHDGSAGTSMYDMRRGHLDFLEDHVLKLPYLIVPPKPRVLIIGVGGGRDVITAVRFGASHVKGIELDPVTIEVIRDTFSTLSNGLFSRPEVELIAAEGRHFIERDQEHYDIIQITGVDTLAAQTSGAYVLAENYLYTSEALQAYLDHLTPEGVLSINSGAWDPNEPQASGRMLLVARKALQDSGVSDPEAHIALIASQRLMDNILVKPQPYTPEQVSRLELEAQRLDFLPLLLPGREGHQTYHALLRETGAMREMVLSHMRYVLDPVTDDSPFFFRFFRWGDLLFETDYGPAHTSALGQLVLLVLLVSLIGLSGLFIVGPLVFFRRRSLPIDRRTVGILTYFVGLGAGFMLLEISLMQRLVLYLGYPTYAVSVVLFSLLVFLGVGSYASRRLVGKEGRALPIALGCVLLLVLFYRFGLPAVERSTLGAPLGVRIGITLLMLAPLGLVLGMFFPLGVRRAESIHPDLVPWAWGINGCASVTASVLAVIIAMGAGFGAVWLAAIVMYAVGILAFLFLTKVPSAAVASA